VTPGIDGTGPAKERKTMTTTTELDLEKLKYPRGRLNFVANPATEQIESWIAEIAALPAQLRAAVQGLNDAQLDTPYRPGGWTVRQLVHHVPDSHMNAYVRTCLVLTEERPTIKPYEQALWAELEFHKKGPVAVSLDLLANVHGRWIPVLRTVTAQQWKREYFHPEDQKYFKLSDLLQVYAWHSRHHLAHITELRGRSGW
jgi:DinB family protein